MNQTVTVQPAPQTLAINGGSSSIKFALFDTAEPSKARLTGKIERIGLPDTRLIIEEYGVQGQRVTPLGSLGADEAADHLIGWIGRRMGSAELRAVGHRVVNGGADRFEAQIIDAELVAGLKSIAEFAPEHMPFEIALIERFQRSFPRTPHIACFDTAFHRNMPTVAKLLPIPRKYQRQGIERYGFHGLSYAYLLEELERVAGKPAAHGKVIMAHLGNGASLAAIKDGHSVDTSMGFTPAAGIPMSTRSGDLDPGLVRYLMDAEKMDAAQFHQMVNHESGLLGLSETSSDIRDLLEIEASDSRAAEAVDVFCYQVRKWIGGFAAALGGVDTLVFSGGIGEHAAIIRQRVCAELGFLGIEIDAERNEQNSPTISVANAQTCVRVIPTNEELMIARAAQECISGDKPANNSNKEQM